MVPTIRIDDDVYAWLQRQARPFEDTPNSVLKRIAGLERGAERGASAGHQRAKGTRRAGEGKTPQSAFRGPIIKVLKRGNGVGDRVSVLRDVEKLMAGQLSDYDLSDIDSGGPRWQKSAEWEIRVMREEGILKPVSETARGVWALTDAGKRAAGEL